MSEISALEDKNMTLRPNTREYVISNLRLLHDYLRKEECSAGLVINALPDVADRTDYHIYLKRVMRKHHLISRSEYYHRLGKQMAKLRKNTRDPNRVQKMSSLKAKIYMSENMTTNYVNGDDVRKTVPTIEAVITDLIKVVSRAM